MSVTALAVLLEDFGCRPPKVSMVYLVLKSPNHSTL